MARLRCQRYLEGLVGEEQCRGVHVVLARESWFQPEQFCSQEPSTASVVDMEAQLWPSKPMHVLVEKMCVVGNSWPLCLARAVTKAHKAQSLLRRLQTAREKKEKQKRKQETQGQEGRQRKKRKGRAKRNHRDLAQKLRARATPAAAAVMDELGSDWEKVVAEAQARRSRWQKLAGGPTRRRASSEPGLPSAAP